MFGLSKLVGALKSAFVMPASYADRSPIHSDMDTFYAAALREADKYEMFKDNQTYRAEAFTDVLGLIKCQLADRVALYRKDGYADNAMRLSTLDLLGKMSDYEGETGKVFPAIIKEGFADVLEQHEFPASPYLEAGRLKKKDSLSLKEDVRAHLESMGFVKPPVVYTKKEGGALTFGR